MKIVNRNNLPESIFNFLKNDLYDGEKAGESYSATELLKPVQEIVLTRRHWPEIEIDAGDRLWSLFGQGVHAVLEKEEDVEPIERIYAEINGKKISGKFDRIKNGIIFDFKVTSAWTVVYSSRFKEWRHQLSIYRWLYWQKYQKELSSKGFIVAILRDWDQRNTESNEKYPKSPIVEIQLTLLSLNETEAMLESKLQVIEEAMNSQVLPKCSPEERWYNEKKKIYNKCLKYCPAFKFCEQAKAS